MAKFPVTTVQQGLGLAGRSPELHLDVSTGGREFAEAMQRFGETLQKSGHDMYVMEAETEYSDARLAAQRNTKASALTLGENIDPHSYHADKEAMIARNQEIGAGIKNALARRTYHLWMDSRLAVWENIYEEARQKRIELNRQAQWGRIRAEAIDAGHLAPAIEYIHAEVKAGRMTQEVAEAEIKQIAYEAEKVAAERLAMRYPEIALKAIEEGPGDKMKGFELLTVDDIREITNIAQGKIADAKQQHDKVKEKSFQAMHVHMNAGEYDKALTLVDDATRNGIFTPEEKGRYIAQIKRLTVARTQHPAVSDPHALRQWYENENAHRNGDLTDDELFAKMVELGPKIDGVRFEKGIEEVYKPADPDDLMENPIIKTYVDILDTMYGELEPDAGVTEALEQAKKKNEAYEAIKQWAHKNPDANADETAKAMQKLIGEPAAKAWYENLWRVLMKDVKFPSNIVPPGKQTYGRFGPAGRKMKTKEGPDTQAEFEEEVRRLNETDRAEALKYYNKWMHKWL